MVFYVAFSSVSLRFFGSFSSGRVGGYFLYVFCLFWVFVFSGGGSVISCQIADNYPYGWFAFPNSFIYGQGLFGPFRLHINRPGIRHWLASVDSTYLIEGLSRRAWLGYRSLSLRDFERYKVIPARTQGDLNKKLYGLPGRRVYHRSEHGDRLSDLRWVSASFCWGEGIDYVASMSSPILLFDRSRLSGVAHNWCSAFLSLISSGVVEVSVYYGFFHVGKVSLGFSDLASI